MGDCFYKKRDKYFKKLKDASKLEEEYKNFMFKHFDECNHFVISTNTTYNMYEGKRHVYYGCIKCGLKTNVDPEICTYEEKLILEYFKSRSCFIDGYYSPVNINFTNAKKLCREILLESPDISNE